MQASPIAEEAHAVRSVASMGCRSVDEFERLNVIQEGTYGIVYRARDKRTDEIVALKKLKMEREKEGFPITSIREIRILMGTKHPNIVDLREVVVGTSISSIYIVMEFLEHDLKDLTEEMETPFLSSEIKCLLQQLLRGVAHLHQHWIVHRDLKTSNLLMNNKGVLKIADFGLARLYGSPQKRYTQMVVTLWYRAPELLLGTAEYTPAIDVWSVGCIFGEWLNKGVPLVQGRTEIQQLEQLCRLLGAPNDRIWPGLARMPHASKLNLSHFPTHNSIRQRLSMTEACFDLLNSMLTYDPAKRITAEAALRHPYFTEAPRPQAMEYMPSFPSAHEGVKRKKARDELNDELQVEESARYEQRSKAAGFQLKF